MIGMLAYYKMRHHPKTGRELNFMFLLSFLSSCFTTISLLVWGVLRLMSLSDYAFLTYIGEFFMGLFFETLLATLVLRLHLTFSDSAYRMSQNIICVFIAIFIVLFVLIVLGVVSFIVLYRNTEYIEDHILGWFCFFSFLIVYFAGSFFAIRFFVNNLSKLAKLRVDSQRKVSLSADDISLNAHQRKWLNLSAKYITLFVIAILSTIFTWISCFVISFEMAAVFVTFDYCINLFCLYLQFAFATGHYKMCCFCLDSYCRRAVSKRMKMSIHRDVSEDH